MRSPTTNRHFKSLCTRCGCPHGKKNRLSSFPIACMLGASPVVSGRCGKCTSDTHHARRRVRESGPRRRTATIWLAYAPLAGEMHIDAVGRRSCELSWGCKGQGAKRVKAGMEERGMLRSPVAGRLPASAGLLNSSLGSTVLKADRCFCVDGGDEHCWRLFERMTYARREPETRNRRPIATFNGHVCVVQFSHLLCRSPCQSLGMVPVSAMACTWGEVGTATRSARPRGTCRALCFACPVRLIACLRRSLTAWILGLLGWVHSAHVIASRLSVVSALVQG